MNAHGHWTTPTDRHTLVPEMSELSLLLPTRQMQALAEAAHDRGVTIGQLLRGVIQQVLRPFPSINENKI